MAGWHVTYLAKQASTFDNFLSAQMFVLPEGLISGGEGGGVKTEDYGTPKFPQKTQTDALYFYNKQFLFQQLQQEQSRIDVYIPKTPW